MSDIQPHLKEKDTGKLQLLCYFSIPFHYVLLSLYVFAFWTCVLLQNLHYHLVSDISIIKKDTVF